MATGRSRPRRTRRAARLRALLLLAGAGLCVPALGQMDLVPRNQTATVNWSAGNVQQAFNYCAESFEEAPDGRAETVIPYAATFSIGGGTAPLTLASGANTLPVTATWRDLYAGIDTILSPGVATTMTQSGAFPNCPGGSNGRLTLGVAAANIAVVPAGTYSRTFSLLVENAGGGRRSRSGNVTFSLVIPSLVKLSNVSDFALGTFDGQNDLVASDTMCVYRNGATAFGITATGSGAGGAFTLAGGAGVLPYSVSWQDSLGTVTLAAGVAQNARGNAYNLNADCNAGAADNVTVTVRATAANLTTVPATGLYSGVLTLIVSAQ